MLRRILTHLEVEDTEIANLFKLSLLSFLLTAGIELGRIGRDSYFLTVSGTDQIPLMYVFIALLTFLASIAYSTIVNRYRSASLMSVFQWFGGVGALVCWAIPLRMDAPPELFPFALFCIVDAFILFILVHFWTLCNALFNVWQGTRLFPIIAAAGLAGTIAGGGSSHFVAVIAGANDLFLVWAVVLGIGASVSWTLRGEEEKRGDQSSSSTEVSLGRTVSILWSQPLLRTLTYMALPMWVIIYIIEFNYYAGMNRVFGDQAALASFMGKFVCGSAFVGLVLQLTLTRWMLRKVSVGSTALVYPLALTFGSVALLVFSLFPQAESGALPLQGIAILLVIARFCDIGIFYSVYDPAQQIMFYSLSEEVRARGRSFIGGVIFPASIATAGGILLLLRHLNEPIYNMAFVAVALSFLLTILCLNLTPDYLKSLLMNFQPEDQENRSRVLEAVSRLEPSDIRYVLLDSIVAPDLKEAQFALHSLLKYRSPDLFEDILEVLPRMSDEIVRTFGAQLTSQELAAHPDLASALQRRSASV